MLRFIGITNNIKYENDAIIEGNDDDKEFNIILAENNITLEKLKQQGKTKILMGENVDEYYESYIQYIK